MTSDVSEIKELLKGRSYQNPTTTFSPAQPPEITEKTPENVEHIKINAAAIEKIKSLKKGDIIDSPQFGTLTYYGKWNGKHALYPAAGQKLIDSAFVIRNSSGDYLAVTDEELASIF